MYQNIENVIYGGWCSSEEIRLENEENEQNIEALYIKDNPHEFSDGDIITDGKLTYKVHENLAKKLLN